MVLQRYWEPKFQKGGFINKAAVREYSDRLIQQYDVRSGQGSVTIRPQHVRRNQQKVVIARVFSENPDVIIVAQPTRGVDVGAMEYIHHRLLDLRDGGKSILLISADLDEVRSLSDRLAVIYGGRIVAEGKPDTWSDMEIGLLMTGGSLAPEKEGTA